MNAEIAELLRDTSTSSKSKSKSAASSLLDDERGAVMVSGLCMACFLIGSLWFIVGIGDSVVFKHKMQEAADHTAITSAMIHARGMNFISACNIVLLIMVAVHLILGIVHDLLLIGCGSTIFLCPFWVGARNTWTTYNNFMKPAARGIHGAELVAAYTYPYAGMTRGYQVGRKYSDSRHNVTVLALGPSQIPHSFVDIKGGSVLGGKAAKGAKLGLPVEAAKFNTICEKLAKDILNWALRAAGAGIVAKYASRLGVIAAETVKFRYCNDLGTGDDEQKAKDAQEEQDKKQNKGNRKIKAWNKLKKANLGFVSGIDPGFDKFWGENGPLIVYKAANNGSPWMQVWGVNVAGQLDDVSERKVGVASRTFDKVAPLVPVKAPVYFAQAEFFFDCTDGWSDPECNEEDNAMYAIKWRARMTRAEGPEIARMLGGFGIQKLFNSDMFKDAVSALKKMGAGSIFSNGLDKVFQSEVRKLLDQYGMNAADGNKNPNIYH